MVSEEERGKGWEGGWINGWKERERGVGLRGRVGGWRKLYVGGERRKAKEGWREGGWIGT